MDFVRYKRGTIWYCKEDNSAFKNLNNLSIGEQIGSRPVLIISNDKFNSYSPVVNVICLTKQDKDNIAHEKINIEGKNNLKVTLDNGVIFELKDSVILGEQFKTVNVKKLTYLGTVSDEIMNKIDEKLQKQLNLSNSSKIVVSKLKEFINKYSEQIIERKTKEKINCNDLIDEIKNNLELLLINKFNNYENNELKNTIKINNNEENNSKIENNDINKNDKEQKILKNSSIKKSKNKYSDEDVKIILENYYSNKEFLMKKYNKSKAELAKLYFYLKNNRK